MVYALRSLYFTTLLKDYKKKFSNKMELQIS